MKEKPTKLNCKMLFNFFFNFNKFALNNRRTVICKVAS